MSDVWPPSLPTEPFVQGYNEGGPKNVISTPVDAGPRKRRRRATKRIDPLTITIAMTTAEVATFKTFFNDTLKDGSLPFDLTHPRELTVQTFAFTEGEYTIVPESGAKTWLVTLNLETA